MFAFLKRTIILLIGFLLITLFIWYAGPVLRVCRLPAARIGVCAADCDRGRGWHLAAVPADEAAEGLPRERTGC